jgi:hypothetical protein
MTKITQHIQEKGKQSGKTKQRSAQALSKMFDIVQFRVLLQKYENNFGGHTIMAEVYQQ